MPNFKGLVGKNSLITKKFVVNDAVSTSNQEARKHGVTPLGVHMQLNLALEEVFGQPAWTRWVNNIYSALGSLYSGGQFPIYDHKCVAYYLKYCFYVHLALIEYRRDIKMLKWKVNGDTDALWDFWGPYKTEIVAKDYDSQLSEYASNWNSLARSFYTAYPFKNIPYIDVVGELLGNVWKDDANGRTNYIYFHMFDNYYSADDTAGLNVLFKRAYRRLKQWLNVANYGFQKLSYNDGSRTYVYQQVLAKIVSDLRKIYNDVDHSYRELTDQEPISCVYSRELIDALNQSPLGIPEIVGCQSASATGYSGTLTNMSNATYGNLVQQFTEDGNFSPMFDELQWQTPWEEGPNIVTTLGGDWTTAFSQNLGARFDVAAKILNGHMRPLTVYHAFDDGASILGEFAFMPVTEIATVHNQTRDEEADFTTANGSWSMMIHGLFGFCVTRIWAYDRAWKQVNPAITFNYATPSSIVVLGSSFDQFSARFISYVGDRSNGMTGYFGGLEYSRHLANSIDAVTTFQWQAWNTADVAVMTDEDVDEWAPLKEQTLIANYGSTAEAMFIDSYVVRQRDTHVTDAYEPDGTVGLQVSKSKRGNYHGKKKKGFQRNR